MAELEGDLVRQIDGEDPIVSDDIERKAKSFAHDVEHWQSHGYLKPSPPNPTPNRRIVGFSSHQTGEYYAEFRGVDWIGSGQDDGSFLSTISNDEYDSRMEEVLRRWSGEVPSRHELSLADLFPEDWDRERVVYDITIRARRLTKEGKPIELQPGKAQSLLAKIDDVITGPHDQGEGY